MRSIKTTLPALGEYEVLFHKESEDVLNWLDYSELNRLARIKHLGVPTAVFEGINHTRREYTLLQCALISLTKTLFTEREGVSLSNEFKFSAETVLSSGEELLKCWSLLSNCGHFQHTYGAENVFLQILRSNEEVRDRFLERISHSELKAWIANVIDNYIVTKTHLAVSVYRVCTELRDDPSSKAKYLDYLSAKLLPLNILFPNSHTARVRLKKLRNVFDLIRLLSIVILDSYNSHHPIRYQLTGTLLQIPNLINSRQNEKFISLLNETAGWLADELYLHPSGVAVRRHYERRGFHRIKSWVNNSRFNEQNFDDTIRIILYNGVSKPYPGKTSHFLRITFKERQSPVLSRSDILTTENNLEAILTNGKESFLSVNENPFTGNYHVDILTKVRMKDSAEYGQICIKLYKWLVRSMEANYLHFTRGHGKEAQQMLLGRKFREIHLESLIKKERKIYENVLLSLITSLLNEKFHVYQDKTHQEDIDIPDISLRMEYSSSRYVRENNPDVYDDSSKALNEHITDNPYKFSKQRLHELKVIKHVRDKIKSKCLIVALEPIIITDGYDRKVDEWDGALLSIDEDRVDLYIVEAKSTASKTSRVKEAYAQLEGTQRLLKSKFRLRTRRNKIRGMGAYLNVRVC